MRSVSTVLAIWGLGFVIAAPTPAQERPDGEKVKPLVSLYGQHSQITEPRLVRVTTRPEWRALWDEHQFGRTAQARDESTAIEVDFSRIMLLAVFQGDAAMCGGFDVDSITETKDRIIVRVRCLYFQVGGVGPEDAERVARLIRSQGWGVFVLPRSNKQVVVERDENNDIRQPPRWRKWKTLPPLVPAAKR